MQVIFLFAGVMGCFAFGLYLRRWVRQMETLARGLGWL
jgi:hypothetical protein